MFARCEHSERFTVLWEIPLVRLPCLAAFPQKPRAPARISLLPPPRRRLERTSTELWVRDFVGELFVSKAERNQGTDITARLEETRPGIAHGGSMPTCCMIRRTKELLVVAGGYSRSFEEEVRTVGPAA